jgi:hypothetical protein
METTTGLPSAWTRSMAFQIWSAATGEPPGLSTRKMMALILSFLPASRMARAIVSDAKPVS